MEGAPGVSKILDEDGWAVITVAAASQSAATRAGIFRILADLGVRPDLVASLRTGSGPAADELSFTVPAHDMHTVVNALIKARPALGCGPVRGEDRVRRVSLLGTGFRGTDGHVASCFEALSAVGVRIGLTSVSDTCITVICDPAQAEVLHAAFGEAALN